MIPQTDPKDETKRTSHHIIPEEQIRKNVQTNIQTNENKAKEDLQTYINKEGPVRDVMIDQLRNNTHLTKEEHGKLLYAAITHNPNNLVRGPLPTNRKNDPKNEIDTEIFESTTG